MISAIDATYQQSRAYLQQHEREYTLELVDRGFVSLMLEKVRGSGELLDANIFLDFNCPHEFLQEHGQVGTI